MKPTHNNQSFRPLGETRQTADRRALVISLIFMTDKEIASALDEKPRTIESDIRSLLKQFQAETRTRLALGALASGYAINWQKLEEYSLSKEEHWTV